MSATARRRRPLAETIGVPDVSDVRAPRWVAARPRWLVAAVCLLGLLVVSAGLRSLQIGGQFWFNEAIATGIASHSFGGVLHAARDGGSAPLYYLLLHFWINGFGDGETATHVLSLLFSLATIPVAGWAGWRLAGPRGALYGAAVFAFSAVGTQYAEETQPYALLLLLALVATTGFLLAFVQRRRVHLITFAVALEAAFYTQGSAALLAFGLLVALIVVDRCAEPADRGAIRRDAALAFGAVALFYVPWLPATIHQISHATAPWHYTPLLGADVPGDLVGGERVDATLAVVVVMALVPALLTRARRRDPEAVALWVVSIAAVAGIALAAVSRLASPTWIARYFMVLVPALLLLAVLSSARTRIVGFVAVVLVVAFCANPSTFAAGHKSDMKTIAGQLGPQLHPGDVVAVAQPEQTPLAWYYMPAGLRWVNALGPVTDPRSVDWDGAQARLSRTAATATLAPVVASLRPGQQLLFVRPLTEGVRNWKSSWAKLVRRRAAQWGQVLTADVADGTLTPVGTAPDTYPGSCCVADSAVLYRKAS